MIDITMKANHSFGSTKVNANMHGDVEISIGELTLTLDLHRAKVLAQQISVSTDYIDRMIERGAP